MTPKAHLVPAYAPEGIETFKALASESRLEILRRLAEGSANVAELGQVLGMAQPTITKHVQILERAGLIITEYLPGAQGMQKRCSLPYDRLLVSLEGAAQPGERMVQVEMPIGLYSLANPGGTCGLATVEGYVGFLDDPQAFLEPARASAEVLWMADGFVEYVFPNSVPPSMEIDRIELMAEVCSEAPTWNIDWPSDITVWINGVELATWTCPADFGGRRGALNPDWWMDYMTQYGLLKIWSADRDGAAIDGNAVGGTKIDDLMIAPRQPITVRIGVKPDAVHPGGFNLFGRHFGNYAQDLVLRLHHSPKPGTVLARSAAIAEEVPGPSSI